MRASYVGGFRLNEFVPCRQPIEQVLECRAVFSVAIKLVKSGSSTTGTFYAQDGSMVVGIPAFEHPCGYRRNLASVCDSRNGYAPSAR